MKVDRIASLLAVGLAIVGAVIMGSYAWIMRYDSTILNRVDYKTESHEYDVELISAVFLCVSTYFISMAGSAVLEYLKSAEYYAGLRDMETRLSEITEPIEKPEASNHYRVRNTTYNAFMPEAAGGAVAWLHIPDTAIDYPVMQGDNNDYYLHHLPDGTPNAGGSLFLDYNHPSDSYEFDNANYMLLCRLK